MMRPETTRHEAARMAIPSVLLVDPDDGAREQLSRALRGSGFAVTTVASAAAGIEAARQETPDFALVEARMPDSKGYDLIDALGPISPRTKIVLMNRYGSIASAVEAMQRGAFHYLAKPVDTAELLATLRRPSLVTSAPTTTLSERDELTPSLARAVWEHMQRVLLECNGNVSATARRLGIARRTLQLKLKKYPPRN
jgi:two-component system response regulator RegA